MTRRRSKISRFPEPIRTQIDEFLDANTEYQRIIQWLREQGYANIESSPHAPALLATRPIFLLLLMLLLLLLIRLRS